MQSIPEKLVAFLDGKNNVCENWPDDVACIIPSFCDGLKQAGI